MLRTLDNTLGLDDIRRETGLSARSARQGTAPPIATTPTAVRIEWMVPHKAIPVRVDLESGKAPRDCSRLRPAIYSLALHSSSMLDDAGVGDLGPSLGSPMWPSRSRRTRTTPRLTDPATAGMQNAVPDAAARSAPHASRLPLPPTLIHSCRRGCLWPAPADGDVRPLFQGKDHAHPARCSSESRQCRAGLHAPSP